MATTPSGLSYDAIRFYAEEIGKHYDSYGDNGCLNHEQLLMAVNGRVEIANSPESSVVDADGGVTVFLPTTTSTRRDRFTIAHELGHYFLHWVYPRKKGTAEVFGRGGRDRAETEANVFASSLLMPEEAFRAAHQQYGGDVWRLAHHFDVSPAAAGVRCQVLGLAGG